MLKRVSEYTDASGAAIAIRDASFPAPFPSGLEYGTPARGTWNIVHTGMLIPEAHEIFVCAAGCLRGVVLTAAEMNAMDRFSTVAIRENNVLDGDMEELIIDGVSDILQKLPELPPAVLVYTSCIHHFMACDLPRVYAELRKRFPAVAFTDCYMNPIMRKSGLTPDQSMRKQLYSLLKKRPLNAKAVNLIGNDLRTYDSCEMLRTLLENGYTFREITRCKTYAEYQEMAEAAVNLSTSPAAVAGGDALEKRLGTKHLYLPFCFDSVGIEKNMDLLCKTLEIPRPDLTADRERAETALSDAFRVIGQTPVSIDYTLSDRPLGLARLLTERGFAVESVYLDGISGEEKDDFRWLQVHVPALMLRATNRPKMRVLERSHKGKLLALGQKAAYFTGTQNFVNIVEGGGLYGYDGISRLAALMTDAMIAEKDARNLIQIKGLGCGCCV